MIKSYVKKPIMIEAYKTEDKFDYTEIAEFVGEDKVLIQEGKVFICTLEGYMEISLGDYIIKGIQGECYPCKPDIFEQTYDIAGGIE